MMIDKIAMSCGRSLEKGDTCFGMGACGASDAGGNCGFDQGLYQVRSRLDLPTTLS